MQGRVEEQRQVSVELQRSMSSSCSSSSSRRWPGLPGEGDAHLPPSAEVAARLLVLVLPESQACQDVRDL